jgi:hypothetical protein
MYSGDCLGSFSTILECSSIQAAPIINLFMVFYQPKAAATMPDFYQCKNNAQNNETNQFSITVFGLKRDLLRNYANLTWPRLIQIKQV